VTWLRWIFVCHFGKRCAKVEPIEIVLPRDAPLGLDLVLSWQCEGCGRVYGKKTAIT
jgi:hypothetical protein